MAAAKIKKGDRVVILSGKDKGKTGEVTQSLPKDGKVVVAGVNVAARHRKPTQTNPQGGIERKEAPLHVSKVAIATADGKPSRVRFETRDGKKVQFSRHVRRLQRALNRKYGKHMRARCVSIVGGMPYPLQNKLLSQPLDILVATPGRLLDHMERPGYASATPTTRRLPTPPPFASGRTAIPTRSPPA